MKSIQTRILCTVLGLTMLASVAIVPQVLAAKRTRYIAVCTEKYEHGGHEVIVGLPRSTFDAANQDGKNHERATRGHRWRVATN